MRSNNRLPSVAGDIESLDTWIRTVLDVNQDPTKLTNGRYLDQEGQDWYCPNRPDSKRRPDYSAARPESLEGIAREFALTDSHGASVLSERLAAGRRVPGHIISPRELAESVLPSLGIQFGNRQQLRFIDELAGVLGRRMNDTFTCDVLATPSEVLLAHREIVKLVGEAVVLGRLPACIPESSLLARGARSNDQVANDLVIEQVNSPSNRTGAPSGPAWFDPSSLIAPNSWRGTERHGAYLAYASDELHLQEQAVAPELGGEVAKVYALHCLALRCTYHQPDPGRSY